MAPHRDGLTPRDTGAQLVELLVERGALAGLTGPGGATLKVRPPLVWEHTHADLFVDLLADALGAL
ncbi:hypothetical protein [Mobilicoccus caccae]|uniref:hypothetical protein n=1 Tax=Mobilicoccus caccae TaxID=1859295 RepID=UPI0024E17F27|nr:hypothetical protein [Mobilicoccus caccae]